MKATQVSIFILIVILSGLMLASCQVEATATQASTPAKSQVESPQDANREFTLQTIVDNGRLAYIGIGGEIDGVVNPNLMVQPDDVVHLILLNGDGMQHDLYLPDFDAKTAFVYKVGNRAEIIFSVGGKQPGDYVYYCTVPGHRQAGQEGMLTIGKP